MYYSRALCKGGPEQPGRNCQGFIVYTVPTVPAFSKIFQFFGILFNLLL